MKRIMIIGSCAAGKSTLAKKLGKILGLPVVHLDPIYWKPGWVRPKAEEWRRTHRKLLHKEKWIIDGNYKSTMIERIDFAEAIIFLNYSKLLCLGRALKRRLEYHNKYREDLGQKYPERITYDYLKWILTYPQTETEGIVSGYKGTKKIYMFRKPSEVEEWLVTIKNS